MDTQEFERIAGLLDRQIEAAKIESERKTRVESAERDLKRVRSQIAAIEARTEELRRMGHQPLPQVAQAVEKLKDEEREAARTLESLGLSPEPAVAPPVALKPEPEYEPLLDSEKMDLFALETEMNGILVGSLPPDEAAAVVETWALRWRIFVDSLDPDRTRDDYDLRRVVAKIHDARTASKCSFLPCLSRGASGIWAAELAKAEARLAELRETKEAASDAFDELRAFLACPPSSDEESTRTLRHVAREAGRFVQYRDLVAEVLEPFRERLGEEFSFMWESDAPVPKENGKARLTNRQIAARLIRRLVNKGMIGGKYVPVSMVQKGLPSHDQGRAKEAIALMLKSGILLEHKDTSGEGCLSVAPQSVAACRSFVDAEADLGTALVDRWCAQDAEAEAGLVA